MPESATPKESASTPPCEGNAGSERASKLVIVESPAKAHTIGRYLGKGYQVRASMGHVRDLPRSKLGVDINNNFTPEYRILPGRAREVAALRKAASGAAEVYMATDLDREGEAIAWHLAELLNLDSSRVRRVVFNEITRDAVQRAFAHPVALDMNKVNAQQARRILDRIVGYHLSPLLWKKVARGLSAGRVQSVAVKLVVEREREIEAFKPQEYWEIEAVLRPAARVDDPAAEFTAKLVRLDGQRVSLPEQAAAQNLVARLRDAAYTVAAVRSREQFTPPPPPFTTSQLQQQAAAQLRFRPHKTMSIAQELYEGVELGEEGAVGLITYMRTDSVRVSDEAIAACRALIEARFGRDYLPEKPHYFQPGKRAQAAHEAIRPTDVRRLPEIVRPYLTADQFRLYELIWKRFVASQMKAARRKVVTLEVAADNALFATEAKVRLFDGCERLLGARYKDVVLPELAEGEPLHLIALNPSQHFTEPPPRFTEASLVRVLERLGIGRPSTYAPIVATIQERGYVRRVKGRLYATELGKLVTDELAKHFQDLINVRFTSQMEAQLDEVEEGRVEWHELLRRFYGAFDKDLEKAMATMERVPGRASAERCSQCGRPMIIRSGKHGLFLGCSGYPQCRGAKPLDSANGAGSATPSAETSEVCEKCGKPMVIRSGRYGSFLGCSGYPQCKNTKRQQPGGGVATAPQATGEVCDKCGKPMVVRASRRGRFLGCSGYPRCRNTRPLPQDESAPANTNGAQPPGGQQE